MNIPEVTDLDLAFSTDKHLPAWETIPEEFKRGHTKWNEAFSTWFFSGLNTEALVAKEGVDKAKALRLLKATMSSWGPKHEHKEAGCAYLMSQFFEDYKP